MYTFILNQYEIHYFLLKERRENRKPEPHNLYEITHKNRKILKF